jgi:uncharacterized integral membrane protein
MEKTANRFGWLNAVSVLLVLPATYFVLISILKYGLGIDGPFDAAQPMLESLGIQDSLGWNINLLILFGPLLALLFSVLQVLHFTAEKFDFRVSILKRWLPLSITGLSVLVLGVLFIYLVGENCNTVLD